MRGGVDAPLSVAELESKFMDNAVYGGWSADLAERVRFLSRALFAQPSLEALEECRA